MRILSGLAFAAFLACLTSAIAQTPNSAVASPAVQKEFDDFLAKFRAALKANNSAALTSMSKAPLDNKDYLQNVAKKRACLLTGKATYGRDGNNDDTYDIFCGEVGFAFTKTPSGFFLTDIGPND